MILHEPLRKSLTEPLKTILLDLNVTATNDEIYKALVEPPNSEMGHLAYGCFIAAKSMKKSPVQAAQDIIAALEKKMSNNRSIENQSLSIGNLGIFSLEAAGPYLNIKFTSEHLANFVLKPLLNRETQSLKLNDQPTKIMVEFSQPNTHKELHVGHMRNLCLGDSIIRLMRRQFGQDQVISSTFPGDVGTHVAKCLWFIKNHIGLDQLKEKAKNIDHRGEWLGQMYSAGNLKLEDEQTIPEKFEKNKAELTEILKQLEHKSGEFYELWKETREWSIQLMKKTYTWAGVDFDRWYWESEVDSDSVKTVKKYLAEGKLQESQGAIGLDLSEEKLGFCMLLKTDGTGLYATKDIELARRKFEDFKIDKSVYVVDMRQALHFKQVFRTLEILGFEQAKNCYHLQYNFVELPDGAMSSRKGNIVPLMTLVKKMEDHVKTNYLSRYKNEWTDIEIDRTAHCVAQGAIKYGMVRQDTNKKIVFEMDEWLKLDGESGPFIQYSYARINSLIRKFGDGILENLNFNGDLLNHPAEIQLMQHLINLNGIIVLSSEQYKPSTLCTYLYETAKKFNFFYHECPIGQVENVDLKKARLCLAAATGEALKYGLNLLGIPVPERM